MTKLASIAVEIDYTNWCGERRKRMIEPMKLVFMETEWHPTPQWILWAADVEAENAVKAFAMSGIHEWKSLS